MMRHLHIALYAIITLIISSIAYAQINMQPIKIAEGTGFYISHDGYVLTANHVVAHCGGDISAHNEQMVLKAKIIDTNPEYDLALLKIVPKLTIENIAYLRPTKQPLHPGEKVAIAGYPDNRTDLRNQFVPFITNDAKITATTGPNGKDTWVQFSYSARPGFSGGPVLDIYGNIVGVTSGGTCTSRNCAQAFRTAIEQLRNAKSIEEVKASEDAVAANSDTNIAVSTIAIKKFLASNNVTVEEHDSTQILTGPRLEEIAESIVNLRCNQSDEDFNSAIRVLKY